MHMPGTEAPTVLWTRATRQTLNPQPLNNYQAAWKLGWAYVGSPCAGKILEAWAYGV